MQIDIKRLRVEVGGRVLLSDLDAQFQLGTLTAVVGPSGSGKSTLLAAIAGYVEPKAGEIRLTGIAKTDVALMTQTTSILSQRTVRDNVAIGAMAAGAAYPQACQTADKLLAEISLTHLSNLRAYKTSGGERQRVGIMRMIARGNTVILADEPTAGLDPVSREIVVQTLRRAADRGLIIVIATHDDFVVRACDAALSPWHNR